MPLFTLADVMKVVRPHLPEALVSPEYQARIAAIASYLPVARTSGFECRLAEQTARADFQMGFTPEESRRALAVDPTLFSAHRGVARFMEDWLEPESLLHQGISHSWFEFDLLPDEATPLHPGMLFCHFTPNAAPLPLLATSLDLLLGLDLHQPLADCLAHLPPTAIFGFGVPLARPVKVARLCLYLTTQAEVEAILTRLNWPSALDAVNPILAATPYEALRLYLDLTEGGIYPRLGLELHPQASKRPRVSTEWEHLLNYLVVQGLCLPEKQAGLLAWPGQGYIDLNFPHVIYRALSHVKITYAPDQPLEAKAYFGLNIIRLNAIFGFQPES